MRDRFDIFKDLCAVADRGEWFKCQELLRELMGCIFNRVWEIKYGK